MPETIPQKEMEEIQKIRRANCYYSGGHVVCPECYASIYDRVDIIYQHLLWHRKVNNA